MRVVIERNNQPELVADCQVPLLALGQRPMNSPLTGGELTTLLCDIFLRQWSVLVGTPMTRARSCMLDAPAVLSGDGALKVSITTTAPRFSCTVFL